LSYINRSNAVFVLPTFGGKALLKKKEGFNSVRRKEACPTPEIVVIRDHYFRGKNMRIIPSRPDRDVRSFALKMKLICLFLW
jgi:hypothetical protein